MTRFLIFAVALLFIPISSFAHDNPWENQGLLAEFEGCYAENNRSSNLNKCSFSRECMDAYPTGVTSIGMLECSRKAHELWDIKLNSEYTILLTHLEPWQHDKNRPLDDIKNAQLAWITYRDTECQSAYSRGSLTGASGGAVKSSCLKRLTAERTIEFAKLNWWFETR